MVENLAGQCHRDEVSLKPRQVLKPRQGLTQENAHTFPQFQAQGQLLSNAPACSSLAGTDPGIVGGDTSTAFATCPAALHIGFIMKTHNQRQNPYM